MVSADQPFEREAPTLRELMERVVDLPPEQAAKVMAAARPAPAAAPPEDATLATTPPMYASWTDFLARTSEQERRRWCAKKAKVANRDRLMSGPPTTRTTCREVLDVLMRAEGRCAFCGSLAVENRPSKPNGAPAPWAPVGRRIGSLGHTVGRIHGGDNTTENLVWSCLWCNVWQDERRMGATDHGGLHL